MRELLVRPGFRRLLVGQAISGLGDWMGTIALMVLVLDLTGSSAAVGGVLVLRLLPGMVAAPIAARASARYGRRRVMLAMDAVRVGIVAALPLLGALWWVYVWAFLLEVASLVFLPARDAAVPVLAGGGGERQAVEERLGLANALVLATSYGGVPIGAGLFGLAFWASSGLGGRWPYAVVFGLDALTFLASYLAIRGIEVAETEDRAPGPRAEGRGFLAGLRLPVIRGVLPGLACVIAGIGALFSVGVSYVNDVLHAGPVQFGLLIACFGTGAAAALSGRALLRGVPAFTQLRAAIALQGVVITTMSLTGSLPLGLLGAVGYGLTGATALIAGVSLLQERLTGGLRDVGLAAVHVTIRIGLALAALAAGVAADLAGHLAALSPPQVVLCGAGLVVLLGALIVHEPEDPVEREGGDRFDVGVAPRGRPAVGDHAGAADPDGGRSGLP